jgi:hypothetical protein
MGAVTVCCPTCWTWSELKRSTTCKRCNTPLILPDGRSVEQVAHPSADAPPPPPPPAYAFNGPAVSFASAPTGGMNWVALARWILVAQGALGLIAVFVIGFADQYINVPVRDAATGRVILETINLRPFLFVAAIAIILVIALFTWLIGFAIARVIYLMLIVLGIFESLSRVSGTPATIVAVTLVDLLFDIGFGFVLVMSLINQPSRSSSY